MRVSISCTIILLFLSIRVFALNLAILEPITTQNVQELQLMDTLGRGIANSLAWNSDGTVLGVASSTGLWLLNGQLEPVIRTSITQPITTLAWSPDGQYLALGSDLSGRCKVQIWLADLNQELLELDSCTKEIRWSPDSQHLAIFNPRSSTQEIAVIDIVTSQVSILLGQDGAWSPDSQILFTRLGNSYLYDGTPIIYSWDANTKEQIFALEINDYQYFTILWAIDQEHIAVQCFDYDEGLSSTGICSLNVRNGDLLQLLEIGKTVFEGECLCLSKLAWNSQANFLAYVFDIPTRGFLSRLLVLDPEGENSNNLGYGSEFAWRAETNQLTAILGNGEIKSYDAQNAAVIAESHFFTAPINQIAIRPDSQEIASSSFGYEQDTHIWNLNNSSFDPRLAFHIEPAELVNYTPNGLELIAGGTIGTDIVVNQDIDAFNPETGVVIRDIEAFYDQGAAPIPRYWNSDYSNYVEVIDSNIALLPNGLTLTLSNTLVLIYIAWSPDNRLIATVERYPDDYSFLIRTWDVATGVNINGYRSGMFSFHGLVWSPNSQQIAVLLEHPTVSNIYVRGLRVFSVLEGEIYDFDRHDYQVFADVNTDETNQQVQATWNSDGTLLAVAMPGSLQIHEVSGGEEALISLPAYDIEALEWSLDGKFIAGGSADGLIYLWGVPSTEE